MTMVTIKSPPNLNHFGEASFSSYLNNEDKSFILTLATHKQISPVFITTKTIEDHTCRDRKKLEEDEIGVFNAERYFNGTMDHEDKSHLKVIHETIANKFPLQEDEHVSINPIKPNSTTPSVWSEATLNSESFLLLSTPKNSDRSASKTSKVLNGKSFFSRLGCCACSDKDSVKTDDHHGGSKLNISATTCVDKNPKKVGQSSTKMKVGKMDQISVLKLRNSKEVVGLWEKGNRSWTIEKRLNMLNWDLNQTEIPPSDDGNISDSGSDASSDLFEIESLKGKDGMYCDAPSEVSIEWSVVTAASITDFPVMSDSDEFKSARFAANRDTSV